MGQGSRTTGFGNIGRKALVAALLATTAVGGGVAASTVAQAQAAYSVPAGPLNRALATFGSQSGTQISYEASIVRGKSSQGVSGAATREQAIAQLLRGTGLSYSFTDATSIVVSPPSAGGGNVSADGSTTLDTIVIQGQGATTEGTGSYTTNEMATATGLPLSIRETPQSVTVVTRQRMEDQGSTSLQEALESASGISVQKFDSDRRDFLVRGFSVNEFQYDGVVIQAEGVYDWGLSNADMTIYDRVEIVKGANGLLQGAGSPGAAVNLVRKRPTDTFQGSLTGTGGSWSTYRSEVDLSGPINPDGTLRGRFAGSFQDGESWLDHYEKKTFTLYGIVEADIGDNTTLSFGADYQKNRPRGSSYTGVADVLQ